MRKKVMDHKGNSYESLKLMLRYYKIKYMTFYRRIKDGWSLQEALEGKFPIIDEDGRKYQSIAQYSRVNNVSVHACYYRMRKHGDMSNQRAVRDHEGNVFESEYDMCKYWNVNYSTYKMRKRRGLSTEDCLYQGNYKNAYTMVQTT